MRGGELLCRPLCYECCWYRFIYVKTRRRRRRFRYEILILLYTTIITRESERGENVRAKYTVHNMTCVCPPPPGNLAARARSKNTASYVSSTIIIYYNDDRLPAGNRTVPPCIGFSSFSNATPL